MPTLLIIGASRGIGLEAVKAALTAGYTVRALARSANAIALNHTRTGEVTRLVKRREHVESVYNSQFRGVGR